MSRGRTSGNCVQSPALIPQYRRLFSVLLLGGVLASRLATALPGWNLHTGGNHPCWWPTPSLPLPGCHSLKAQDRFCDLRVLHSERGQNATDVHSGRIATRAEHYGSSGNSNGSTSAGAEVCPLTGARLERAHYSRTRLDEPQRMRVLKGCCGNRTVSSCAGMG
jgi:hypothetical protein